MSNAVDKRQAIEKRILKSFVSDIIKAGFAIAVDDGDDGFFNPPSTNSARVMDDTMAMDEDHLYVFRIGEEHPIGWTHFVYGNDGWDVLSDYTVNLAPYIVETQKLIDALSE